MTTTEFTCAICNQLVTHSDNLTTGYGLDDQDRKVCYACCGNRDREQMIKSGKATLYLITENDGPFRVCNWPNSLSFDIHQIKNSHHNLAGRRYDVWFVGPDGWIWHGITCGDNTQICHCKRTKLGMGSNAIKIRARLTDLTYDGGSWSENASQVREVTLSVPQGLSDLALARRIKAALGIEYMRTDHWCGAGFCWRNGFMGAYADFID